MAPISFSLDPQRAVVKEDHDEEILGDDGGL